MARLTAVVVLPSSAPGLKIASVRQPLASMRCSTCVRNMRNATAAGSVEPGGKIRLRSKSPAAGSKTRVQVYEILAGGPFAAGDAVKSSAGETLALAGGGASIDPGSEVRS